MKKRLISLMICIVLLIGLLPTEGLLALAAKAEPVYAPTVTLKLSKDGEAFALALVTLIDDQNEIYLTEAVGAEGDFYCYRPEQALPAGHYRVYENGYLAREIEISSTFEENTLEIPCYSFSFQTHESGAAIGTALTCEYVPYPGAEAQTVINYSVLPANGTLTAKAVPAGADTYTVKWAFAAPFASPEEDGSYVYTTTLTNQLELVCFVQGSYLPQSASDAISITYPESGTTVTKITNPVHGSGEADGLNTNDPLYPANRINSYAWAMASNVYTGPTTEKLTNGKEYLYVGTNRNLYGGIFRTIETFLFMGLSETYDIPVRELEKTITKDQLLELFNIALDLYFAGDFPQIRSLFGNAFLMALSNQAENWVGQILRIDPDTGASEVVYTNNTNGSNYRSAIEMNNNLYFGSAFGNFNSIIKIDGEGKAKPIFENGISDTLQSEFDLSLRAGTVYDEEENTLICGGVVGVRENAQTSLWEVSGVQDATATSPVVFLLKDNGNGTCSTKIICDAGGKEFGILKAGSFNASIYSGGIWDICMYRGEPYMTVVEDKSFSVWHGREAVPGEEDNGYGWVWEKIWTRDGKEIDDAIEFSIGIPSIDYDSNAEDVIATMYVYNDRLYFGCFDNFASVFIKSMLSSASNLIESRSGEYLKDSFLDLYRYLTHKSSLFYYDGTEVRKDAGFEKATADQNVDYLWRMIEYHDDFYVTSYDAEVMERYVLPLQTKRMQYVVSRLGLTFDFSYSDILPVLEALKQQSPQINSYLLFGKNFLFRPDSAAGLIATALSDILEDSSGNPFAISPRDILENPKLMAFFNQLSLLYQSFENEKIDYQTLTQRVEKLLERYADVTIKNDLKIEDLAQAIDFSGLALLLHMNDILDENNAGFDLYVLDHATNRWSALFTDGCNDPYNYGGRTLAVCDDKLYVGTANPFYGAQIWRVMRGKKIGPSDRSAKTAVSGGDLISFKDVLRSDYYFDAVYWGVKNQITNGTRADAFSPDENVSRAQFITFLWRAAGCPEPTTKICPFADVPTESYFRKAVLWAVENGITNGTSAAAFSPDKAVSRAQTVTFLYRYAGEPSLSEPQSAPFDDVKAESYYYRAVIWAEKNLITQGQSASHFAPQSVCTRAQAITLIFRVFG